MSQAQSTISTSQPGTTNLPEPLSGLPTGDPPTTWLLILTFCVWLLRQQAKEK